jgi:hypothetical protein
MKALIVMLGTALLVGAAQATETATDFKGVPVGGGEHQIKEKFPRVRCKDSLTAIADRICGDLNSTIADVPASVFFFLVRGKINVISVGFNVESFDRVERALKSKFGRPSSVTERPLQNRSGETYLQKESVWLRPDAQLSLKKYAGRRTTSSFSIADRNLPDEVRRRTQERNQGPSKDL